MRNLSLYFDIRTYDTMYMVTTYKSAPKANKLANEIASSPAEVTKKHIHSVDMIIKM